MTKTAIMGVVIGGLLALTASAPARTITVGSSGADYTTIAAGVNAALVGDTVAVQAGTYNERVNSVRAGQAGARIVITSSPRRMATVNGASITHNYITLEGFSSKNNGISVNARYITVTDNYVEGAGVGISACPSAKPPYDRITDLLLSRNRIHNSQYGFMVAGTDIIIEHNEVTRLRQYDPNGDSDYSRAWGENIVYRYNYFHGTDLAETGDAHVDCIQTFTNNGEYMRNLLVENNYFSDCHQGLMSSNVGNTDIRDFLIRNNVYTNCSAWSLLALNDIKNVVIVNNYIEGIIGIRSGSTGTIKNNYIATGYLALYDTPAENISFQGNLVRRVNSTIGTPADFKNTYPDNFYDLDPLCVDPSKPVGSDGVPFTADDGMHLQSNSPCINKGKSLTGIVDTDMYGTARPVGSEYDIGPVEYMAVGIRDNRLYHIVPASIFHEGIYDVRGCRVMPHHSGVFIKIDHYGHKTPVLHLNR